MYAPHGGVDVEDHGGGEEDTRDENVRLIHALGRSILLQDDVADVGAHRAEHGAEVYVDDQERREHGCEVGAHKHESTGGKKKPHKGSNQTFLLLLLFFLPNPGIK